MTFEISVEISFLSLLLFPGDIQNVSYTAQTTDWSLVEKLF